MNAVNWSAMLPEIMEMISDRLPIKDFLSFRSVCKTWQSLPSGRSDISKFSTDKFWLLIYESLEDKCYLYSSTDSKPCTFHLPDLKGATVMHSKYGWLIAHKKEHFFLYNFFTLTKINLPDHAVSENQACTFTTLPIQKDCTVFIFTRKSDLHVEISSCHVGDNKWEVKLLDMDRSMINVLDAVMCGNCSPYKKCCTLQNMFLIASKDEKRAMYDYAGNLVVWVAASPANENCYHVTEWIHKFGSEKGAMVRICSLSCKIGMTFGLKCGACYYSASTESVPNYDLAKAAIIETQYLKIEDVPE